MAEQSPRAPGGEVSASPDARTLVEQSVPGCWPTSDDEALRAVAAGLDGLGRRVQEIARDIEAMHRDVECSVGRFPRAVLDGRDRLLGAGAEGLSGLVDELTAMAAGTVAFADLTVTARHRVELIAAIVDRDRLLGEIGAALGDDTLAVRAASAGRLALTAAGDDYAEQSADTAAAHQSAGDHDGQVGAPAGAATSAMMPMAGFAGMGAAAAGAGAAGGRAIRAASAERTQMGIDDDEPPELTRAECDAIMRRAAAVQASLPDDVASWVQTAVGVGDDRQNGRIVVVATSDPVPYLRVGMVLRAAEELVGDGRDPQVAVLDHMMRAGLVPLAVASTQPPTPAARAALADAGIRPLLAPRQRNAPER
ncbi:hypothetical protein ACLQ3C_02695 [Gordonia sp. DT30]|uniref:hypothetical protein n=1 Tax=Gordonia sp. DT30 TaxID=3416546 RepID=UPI003CFA1CA9